MKKIRSSEIASYLFCPACWYVGRIKGVIQTSIMGEGEKYHVTIAKNEQKAKFIYASIVIILAVFFILVMYRLLQ